MRIVVKVGTSTLAHPTGQLNIRHMEELCKVLSDIKNAGDEVILVSSGAIGMGMGKLHLRERPKSLPEKQAAAAVGQCELMYTYDKLFSEYNHTVAQILLTGDDIEEADRAEHLQSTFSALLETGIIPIVNENDSVSSAEIETGHHKVLGDNDTLSALVAGLCKADLLVLLSDIDGLYDADPKTHP
ncbi:MAG: glutamate 5-kinase, partial [Clostridia bacterium]|nr:glutamate 5-kinase [Clostridia bacterium]